MRYLLGSLVAGMMLVSTPAIGEDRSSLMPKFPAGFETGLEDIYRVCAKFADRTLDGGILRDASWGVTIDGDAKFYTHYEGEKDLGELGSGELYAIDERFISTRMLYCKVKTTNGERAMDLRGLSRLANVVGEVYERDGTTYGVWEHNAPNGAGLMMIVAEADDDSALVEFNFVGPMKPAQE